MNEPLISVIIPVFNEETRVARAVGSMQRQTYANLEIIVVDDGSTDDTYGVVEAIAKKDSRISLHRNPKIPARFNWRGYDINAGFAARNYGFSIAKGEWITTQDADDASLLNRIEVQYHIAVERSATMVTVDWQRLTPERLGKQLDTKRILREQGDAAIINPATLLRYTKESRGLLMREPFHQYVPFPLKWFPYTRKLFYRTIDLFPGADNCMFFHTRVRDDGIYLRHRNERTWGVPSGRGSGRDFVMRVAARYNNSWYYKLPLYLWDVKTEHQEYQGYDRYLT